MAVHGLKYTHKRYCKGQQPAQETHEPPQLEKPTAVELVPTDEQIAVFLQNQKKQKQTSEESR